MWVHAPGQEIGLCTKGGEMVFKSKTSNKSKTYPIREKKTNSHDAQINNEQYQG